MTVTTTRGRPPVRAGAPRGEPAVRAALVAAATELFAAQGPGATSIRAIAERAGVNHGLVHQYFGSKAGLVTAVLDDLSARSIEEVRGHTSTATVYAEDGPTAVHGRILAHLLLEGADPAALKSNYPVVEAMIGRYRADGVPAREARERVAQVVALVMGWQLFEPFLAAAADLPLTDASRKRLLDDAIHKLLGEGVRRP